VIYRQLAWSCLATLTSRSGADAMPVPFTGPSLENRRCERLQQLAGLGDPCPGLLVERFIERGRAPCQYSRSGPGRCLGTGCGRQLCARDGLDRYRPLAQAPEQRSALPRSPAVEAKREFVRAAVWIAGLDRALVCAEQPALGQGRHALDSGEVVADQPLVPARHDDLASVAAAGQTGEPGPSGRACGIAST